MPKELYNMILRFLWWVAGYPPPTSPNLGARAPKKLFEKKYLIN